MFIILSHFLSQRDAETAARKKIIDDAAAAKLQATKAATAKVRWDESVYDKIRWHSAQSDSPQITPWRNRVLICYCLCFFTRWIFRNLESFYEILFCFYLIQRTQYHYMLKLTCNIQNLHSLAAIILQESNLLTRGKTETNTISYFTKNPMSPVQSNYIQTYKRIIMIMIWLWSVLS